MNIFEIFQNVPTIFILWTISILSEWIHKNFLENRDLWKIFGKLEICHSREMGPGKSGPSSIDRTIRFRDKCKNLELSMKILPLWITFMTALLNALIEVLLLVYKLRYWQSGSKNIIIQNIQFQFIPHVNVIQI